MTTKVAFVSLGCDKNRVDSEVMLGLLKQAEMEIVMEEEQADVIIVNTCCFIQDALEESIETILEMAKLKQTGKCKGLIVTGCLAQRYSSQIFQEMPEVDAILGATAFEDIVAAVNRIQKGEKQFQVLESIDKPMQNENAKLRILSTVGYYAYLKISEGCDNHCTYCVIPNLKGKHRSRTIESLVEEASFLAEQGVKELILVAQDTSIYGRDLYGQSKLGELLHRLCAIDSIEWVRVLYCYPETLTEETIQVMAQEKKVCHYIDLPIQHASDTVLKRMGRKSSNHLLREKIKALRTAMPDIAVRTTLIVGFPGETEQEFQELYDFVEEMRFERLGVFCYSQEEETPAASMPNQIEEEIKESRKQKIMQLQKEIAFAYCQKQIGKTISVLTEGKLTQENVYCGRTQWDAPEIDGLVFFGSHGEIYSGDFANVMITDAKDYDLIGDVVYADESGK